MSWQTKPKKKPRGKLFVKGDPRCGRPKGCPNKVTVEARQAATELVDDPEYRAKLLQDLRDRRLAPAIEQMLWYYSKGKPKETVEHTGPDGGPIELARIERVILNEPDTED